MLKDTTRPISVSSLGVCPELAPENLPDDWFTGGSYTMVTSTTATCPSAVRELVPEEQLILVACKGSLETNIRDGFVGLFPHRSVRKGVSAPILEISGFALPTTIIDPLLDSALACESLPVVFSDQDGNTFVVRYAFNMDWLYGIQAVEMS